MSNFYNTGKPLDIAVDFDGRGFMSQQPHNKFEKHLQKVKIKHLKGNTFLEIGCGDCSVFKDTSFIVDGYDIDPEPLKNCSHYRKVSTNLEDFDIPSYDAICLLGVLEHMEEEDITDLQEKIKDANSIYITVPNALSFHRVIGVELGIIQNYFDLGKQDHEIGHKRYYNIGNLWEKFKGFMERNNFSVAILATEGFKFDRSTEMERYLDRIEAIENAARKLGWIGINNYRGAELIINLKKNE